LLLPETGAHLFFFCCDTKNTSWLLFADHLLERFRCFPIHKTFADLRRRLNIFNQSVCGPGFGTRSSTTFVPGPEGDSFTEMQSGSFPIAIRAIRRPRTLNKIQFSTWGPFRERIPFLWATDFKSCKSC